ncbi:hypothetical protein BC832DRAFT_333380 [Gaertneriomyces semiglobifer]|nr:hypothetical protein BC832DRAFT_333380 [Gaertneriomyces semiglobifer]
MPEHTLHTINARAEKVQENTSMWKAQRNRKRCVVVAEGFFEWEKRGKDKQPYFIRRDDGKLLMLGGLYDHATIDGKDLWSYTIITVPVSKELSFVHNRMPLILEESDVDQWLDPTVPFNDEIKSIMRPKESGMKWHAVSSVVGKVGNDVEECIQPIEIKSESGKSQGDISSFFTKPKKVQADAEVSDYIKKEDNEVQREIGLVQIDGATEGKREGTPSHAPTTGLNDIEALDEKVARSTYGRGQADDAQSPVKRKRATGTDDQESSRDAQPSAKKPAVTPRLKSKDSKRDKSSKDPNSIKSFFKPLNSK